MQLTAVVALRSFDALIPKMIENYHDKFSFIVVDLSIAERIYLINESKSPPYYFFLSSFSIIYWAVCLFFFISFTSKYWTYFDSRSSRAEPKARLLRIEIKNWLTRLHIRIIFYKGLSIYLTLEILLVVLVDMFSSLWHKNDVIKNRKSNRASLILFFGVFWFERYILFHIYLLLLICLEMMWRKR